jgi:hypothetical protein
MPAASPYQRQHARRNDAHTAEMRRVKFVIQWQYRRYQRCSSAHGRCLYPSSDKVSERLRRWHNSRHTRYRR